MALSEAIGNVLSRLAELLGLKESETQRLAKLEERLKVNRATNIDKMEGLKEEIRALERQALRKKEEYEKAKGPSKRITKGEIERIFGELDHLRGRETILGRNIEKLTLGITKVEEVIAGQAQGMGETEMDDVALDLDEVVGDLKATDRAAADLERVKYEAPASEKRDVDALLSNLEGETEASSDLSQSMSERLKELAGDDE